MPPFMPPLLLLVVYIFPSSIRRGSFACEPRMSAKAKPAPNSTPLTAGTLNIRWASTLSIELKKGSPIPAGMPQTAVSKMPPTESKSIFAARIACCISSPFASSKTAKALLFSSFSACASFSGSVGSAESATPAHFARCVPTVIPCAARICRQIAPAATIGAVSRPEKCPPPR